MAKTISVRGEIQWANNLSTPDTKFPTADGAGVFRANIKPDADSLEAMAGAGLRLKAKDGYYTFRRPEFKLFKGEKAVFGPPPVTGSAPEKLIGNGSVVTAKVTTYNSKFGIGHRLESVHVDTLIEYVPPAVNAEPPVF